jgi:hypothetical protein
LLAWNLGLAALGAMVMTVSGVGEGLCLENCVSSVL